MRVRIRAKMICEMAGGWGFMRGSGGLYSVGLMSVPVRMGRERRRACHACLVALVKVHLDGRPGGETYHFCTDKPLPVFLLYLRSDEPRIAGEDGVLFLVPFGRLFKCLEPLISRGQNGSLDSCAIGRPYIPSATLVSFFRSQLHAGVFEKDIARGYESTLE
jgi:hypothetical protein